MHPLAFKENKSCGNSGAWNEVQSGDEIICLIDGRIESLMNACMMVMRLLHGKMVLLVW